MPRYLRNVYFVQNDDESIDICLGNGKSVRILDNQLIPMASTSTAGIVMPDGTTLGIYDDKLVVLGGSTSIISPVLNAMSTNETAAGSKAAYDYVTEAISSISGISMQIVDVLPDVGQPSVIYLVAKSVEGADAAYDEYIWLDDSWEKIGTTAVDLTDYLKTTDIADWAKAPTKPTYTAANVEAAPISHASNAATHGLPSATAYGHAMASSVVPKEAGMAAVGTEATKFARGDHVHPVQTSVSGNAGTATKLATARTINGTPFDGTTNITVADNTKAPVSHTHSIAQITDMPIALTNAEIAVIITAAGG